MFIFGKNKELKVNTDATDFKEITDIFHRFIAMKVDGYDSFGLYEEDFNIQWIDEEWEEDLDDYNVDWTIGQTPTIYLFLTLYFYSFFLDLTIFLHIIYSWFLLIGQIDTDDAAELLDWDVEFNELFNPTTLDYKWHKDGTFPISKILDLNNFNNYPFSCVDIDGWLPEFSQGFDVDLLFKLNKGKPVDKIIWGGNFYKKLSEKIFIKNNKFKLDSLYRVSDILNFYYKHEKDYVNLKSKKFSFYIKNYNLSTNLLEIIQFEAKKKDGINHLRFGIFGLLASSIFENEKIYNNNFENNFIYFEYPFTRFDISVETDITSNSNLLDKKVFFEGILEVGIFEINTWFVDPNTQIIGNVLNPEFLDNILAESKVIYLEDQDYKFLHKDNYIFDTSNFYLWSKCTFDDYYWCDLVYLFKNNRLNFFRNSTTLKYNINSNIIDLTFNNIMKPYNFLLYELNSYQFLKLCQDDLIKANEELNFFESEVLKKKELILKEDNDSLSLKKKLFLKRIVQDSVPFYNVNNILKKLFTGYIKKSYITSKVMK